MVTGYNEPIEVITAEFVSENQSRKAAYFAKWEQQVSKH